MKKLHKYYNGFKCGAFFPVFQTPNCKHSMYVESIPFVIDENIIKKLEEIENRPDFQIWARDPYTNKINVQIEWNNDKMIKRSKTYAVICPSCSNEFEALSEDHQHLLKKMLVMIIGSKKITSDNIGDIRRSLFLPFDCGDWNGLVRDMTAESENK